MGNANSIYDDKCLNLPLEHIKDCPVYREHLENEKFLNQLGRVFEKLVFQDFDLTNVPNGDRLSWYQLMGQIVKRGGLSMSKSDPFKEPIIITGQAEKLIGQIENEFALACNSQILVPIQELRSYCQTSMQSTYMSFLEGVNNFRANEQKSPSSNKENSRFDNSISKRDVLQDLHKRLHQNVIYVYETMINLKVKVPSMIEHQLQINMYSTAYLEYVLHLFKENKSIVRQALPFKKYKEGAASRIQDYRQNLKNPSPNPQMSSKHENPYNKDQNSLTEQDQFAPKYKSFAEARNEKQSFSLKPQKGIATEEIKTFNSLNRNLDENDIIKDQINKEKYPEVVKKQKTCGKKKSNFNLQKITMEKERSFPPGYINLSDLEKEKQIQQDSSLKNKIENIEEDTINNDKFPEENKNPEVVRKRGTCCKKKDNKKQNIRENTINNDKFPEENKNPEVVRKRGTCCKKRDNKKQNAREDTINNDKFPEENKSPEVVKKQNTCGKKKDNTNFQKKELETKEKKKYIYEDRTLELTMEDKLKLKETGY